MASRTIRMLNVLLVAAALLATGLADDPCFAKSPTACAMLSAATQHNLTCCLVPSPPPWIKDPSLCGGLGLGCCADDRDWRANGYDPSHPGLGQCYCAAGCSSGTIQQRVVDCCSAPAAASRAAPPLHALRAAPAPTPLTMASVTATGREADAAPQIAKIGMSDTGGGLRSDTRGPFGGRTPETAGGMGSTPSGPSSPGRMGPPGRGAGGRGGGRPAKRGPMSQYTPPVRRRKPTAPAGEEPPAARGPISQFTPPARRAGLGEGTEYAAGRAPAAPAPAGAGAGAGGGGCDDWQGARPTPRSFGLSGLSGVGADAGQDDLEGQLLALQVSHPPRYALGYSRIVALIDRSATLCQVYSEIW